jgi:tetratricopeptide (TPR) repeat protein
VTTLTSFLESTASLIAAIGALLTGSATIINAVMQHRNVRVRSEEAQVKAPARFPRSTKATLAIGLLLLFLSAGLFAGRVLSSGKHTLNVELTTAAWDAFNKKDFARAIANADKCISEFRGAADREQNSLEKAGTLSPPTGKVSNEEKTLILSRGLLNDVATCYYIKGRSAQELGRRDEAMDAYKAATKYTYARCWDPQGWFWAPAEAAQDRLATMK